MEVSSQASSLYPQRNKKLVRIGLNAVEIKHRLTLLRTERQLFRGPARSFAMILSKCIQF